MTGEGSPPRKRSTLAVGCGLLLLAGVIVVIVTPKAIPISQARQKSCENNLKQLHVLSSIYRSQFGGPDSKLPTEQGRAFWLKLTQTTPPLIDAGELEVLLCPESEELPRVGFASYSGPPKDANAMEDGEILGCCRHAHPDGMIFLRKDGKIFSAKGKESDQLAGKTKD